MARNAGHGIDVAPHGDAVRMLPGDVRSAVSRVRVLIRHHRPAVLHRELSLPRRHRRALGLERFHLAAFAHAPEPVVVAHLGNAVLVTEVRGLERQRQAGRSLAVPLVAVADGAAHRIDFLASRDHHRVGPYAQRDMDVRVLERRRHVCVSSLLLMHVAVRTRRRRIGSPKRKRQHGHRSRHEGPASVLHASSPQKSQSMPMKN